MKMQSVASSNIKAIGFEDGEMRIEFMNGNTYAYTGPRVEEHYQAIVKAESAGKYLAQHIRTDTSTKAQKL